MDLCVHIIQHCNVNRKWFLSPGTGLINWVDLVRLHAYKIWITSTLSRLQKAKNSWKALLQEHTLKNATS